MEHVSYGYEGRQQSATGCVTDDSKRFVGCTRWFVRLWKINGGIAFDAFLRSRSGVRFLSKERSIEASHRSSFAQTLPWFRSRSICFREPFVRIYWLADPNANDEKLKERYGGWTCSFLKTLPKGLDSDVGNAGAALSGGQRQKMGIARALLSEAQYMIFDEATSSVDPQSEREIWETIGRLSKTRTLIIISHRMSTIQNANCIYVLEKGVVAQRGSHAELMQQGGLYRELVTRQQAMEVAE